MLVSGQGTCPTVPAQGSGTCKPLVPACYISPRETFPWKREQGRQSQALNTKRLFCSPQEEIFLISQIAFQQPHAFQRLLRAILGKTEHFTGEAGEQSHRQPGGEAYSSEMQALSNPLFIRGSENYTIKDESSHHSLPNT